MRRLTAVCVLAVLLGLSGCSGGKKVSVSGTVTHGGEKLTWPDGGVLLVIFQPENPDKNPERYSATTDTATSSYKIDAIPPGKYTVAVQQFDERFNDAFGKAYDLPRTDIKVEVTHDGQVLDIEVPAVERGKGGFGGRGGKRGFGRGKGGPPPEPPPGPPAEKGEPVKAEPAPPPHEKKDEPAKPADKKD